MHLLLAELLLRGQARAHHGAHVALRLELERRQLLVSGVERPELQKAPLEQKKNNNNTKNKSWERKKIISYPTMLIADQLKANQHDAHRRVTMQFAK